MEFKKGDKVVCLIYGDGVVFSVDANRRENWPIRVLFSGGNKR